MKHFFLSLISFLLLAMNAPLTKAAEGGSGSGNGGDAVVCPNKAPRLLDVYELELFDKKTPQLGSSTANLIAKVESVLSKVDSLAPETARIWRANFKELISRTSFTNDPLVDIPDSLHTILPIGCTLQQLAIQSRTAGEISLLINQPLWDAMNVDNQAALYLHEILYADAVDLGKINSIQAREMNRILLSLGSMSESTFNEWLDKTHYPVATRLASGDVIFTTSSVWTSRGEDRTCGFISKTGLTANCRKGQGAKEVYLDTAKTKIIGFSSYNGIDAKAIGIPWRLNGLHIPSRSVEVAGPGILIESFGLSFKCLTGSRKYIRFHREDVSSTGRFRVSPNRIESCDILTSLNKDEYTDGTQKTRVLGVPFSSLRDFKVIFPWDFSGASPRALGAGYSVESDSNLSWPRDVLFEIDLGDGKKIKVKSFTEYYDDNSVRIVLPDDNNNPYTVTVGNETCTALSARYFIRANKQILAGAKFKYLCPMVINGVSVAVSEFDTTAAGAFKVLKIDHVTSKGIKGVFFPIANQIAAFSGNIEFDSMGRVKSGTLVRAANLPVLMGSKIQQRVVPGGFDLRATATYIQVVENQNMTRGLPKGYWAGEVGNSEMKDADIGKMIGDDMILLSGPTAKFWGAIIVAKNLRVAAGLMITQATIPVCVADPTTGKTTIVTQVIYNKIIAWDFKGGNACYRVGNL